jgi:DNA primase
LRRYSKQDILASVKISEIAESQGIALSEANSGNFTHKCKCPGTEHKSGLERTGSLYIDNQNNNFYCFGCGASNNAIDFYMLCTDRTFTEAIEDLSVCVDPNKARVGVHEKKQSTLFVLLEISEILRNLQRKHSDDAAWIESLIKKMDSKISLLDRYDVAGAKRIQEKLKKILHRRYFKL